MAWRGHAHDARRVGGGVTRVTRVLNREIVWGMWMMRKAVYLKVLKGMRETVPFLLPSGPHLLLLCPAFVIPLPLSNLILPATRSPWFQFHVQSTRNLFKIRSLLWMSPKENVGEHGRRALEWREAMIKRGF